MSQFYQLQCFVWYVCSYVYERVIHCQLLLHIADLPVISPTSATVILSKIVSTTTDSLDMTVSTVNDSHITTTIVDVKSQSVAVTDDLATYTTQLGSNVSFSITPTVNLLPPSISNESLTTLFITTGVLVSLLIGSIIVFCTVLCVYRWKRYVGQTIIQMLKN